jgi:hypothetical protein
LFDRVTGEKQGTSPSTHSAAGSVSILPTKSRYDQTGPQKPILCEIAAITPKSSFSITVVANPDRKSNWSRGAQRGHAVGIEGIVIILKRRSFAARGALFARK